MVNWNALIKSVLASDVSVILQRNIFVAGNGTRLEEGGFSNVFTPFINGVRTNFHDGIKKFSRLTLSFYSFKNVNDSLHDGCNN